MYLAVSLRGNAQGVLGNLPGTDQRDYKALCIALEQRFAPTNQTELYRAQLRERKQKAVETLPELGQDIRRLTNLAYPTAAVHKTKRHHSVKTERRHSVTFQSPFSRLNGRYISVTIQ